MTPESHTFPLSSTITTHCSRVEIYVFCFFFVLTSFYYFIYFMCFFFSSSFCCARRYRVISHLTSWFLLFSLALACLFDLSPALIDINPSFPRDWFTSSLPPQFAINLSKQQRQKRRKSFANVWSDNIKSLNMSGKSGNDDNGIERRRKCERIGGFF